MPWITNDYCITFKLPKEGAAAEKFMQDNKDWSISHTTAGIAFRKQEIYSFEIGVEDKRGQG